MEDRLNDNVVIPEDIRKMTLDELRKAIKDLETELAKGKKTGNSSMSCEQNS